MSKQNAAKGDNQSTLIASLMTARAYPHPAPSIELVETHISWVILTGPFAYKIKKAIKLDFLDFSTLDRRRQFCDEELRLNKRWAPELYLEVLPVCGSYDHPSIGDDGAAIEYVLKMVQFPQSAQLDEQLTAGLLNEKDMYALAETIAAYHDQAKVIDYSNDKESVGKVRAPMLENFAPVKQAIDMNVLSRVQLWTAKNLRILKPILIQRRKDGFVRECHGDLHLANLVRSSAGIVAFDCVEFSEELRNIDTISDIAFLVMDLVAHARQDLAYVLLNRYLECTGDYSGMDVFGLYFVYHCMIRAKVAAIRSNERTDDDERQHDIEKLKHNLAVAARWIETRKPMVIAMHGYSGSGKTWLSSQLMSQLPAIRIRSDIERKRRFGLDEAASSGSGPGSGIYTERSRTSIYEGLFATAETLLSAGFDVIVDASFLRQTDRHSLATLADRLSVTLAYVDTSADHAELERRLRNRSAVGGDASEADIEILRGQLDSAERLDEAERQRTVTVVTDTGVDVGQVIKMLNRMEN